MLTPRCPGYCFLALWFEQEFNSIYLLVALKALQPKMIAWLYIGGYYHSTRQYEVAFSNLLVVLL